MSEQFISPREEQIDSTMEEMRETVAEQTPEQKEESLKAGVEMMADDLEENRTFYARMKGVAALRATVEVHHSKEVHGIARQLYGPLGYDSSPRKIRKI